MEHLCSWDSHSRLYNFLCRPIGTLWHNFRESWVVRDLKDHLVPAPIPTPIYPASSLCPLSEGTLCGLQGPGGSGWADQLQISLFIPENRDNKQRKYWICKGMIPNPSVFHQVAECSYEQSTGTCCYVFITLSSAGKLLSGRMPSAAPKGYLLPPYPFPAGSSHWWEQIWNIFGTFVKWKFFHP